MAGSRISLFALIGLGFSIPLIGQPLTPAPTPTPQPCDEKHIAACSPCGLKVLEAKQAKIAADPEVKKAMESAKAAQAKADKSVAKAEAAKELVAYARAQLQPLVEKVQDAQATLMTETMKMSSAIVRGPREAPKKAELQLLQEGVKGAQAVLNEAQSDLEKQRLAVEKASLASGALDNAAKADLDDANKAEANVTAAANKAAAGADGTNLSSQLKNLHFGLGIGVLLLGHRDIVNSELTGDHVVRVTDEEKAKAGVWLDLHYPMFNLLKDDHTRVGMFVAVQLANTTGETLNSVAFGPLFSWKVKPICDDSDKAAFNIGLGAARTKIQTFGSGIVENQPLPAGEQQVRYRKTSAWGGVLMFSFNVL